jgi:hypothetical protein
MTGLATAAIATGALLPPSVMDSSPVRVLAAFVTVNTVMYCALAVAKILPRLHPTTWFPNDNRRSAERSIYPSGQPPVECADHAAPPRPIAAADAER